ncbi:MAG: hypothetical protein DYG92_03655 [Leptolyngbya sp. PLA1]|nr:hypothetical protein [Leptolyngbya sp. PLA1]
MLAICVAGCGPSESTPTSARVAALPEAGVKAKSEPSGSLFLEENAKEFYVELSRSGFFGVETYASLRFVPWRQVSKKGSEVNVRMGLGYGIGVPSAARASLEEAKKSAPPGDLSAVFFEAMTSFEERTHFQLSRDDLRSLRAFIESLEEVELRPPPEHVAARFIQGKWGDLQVRKDDNGMYISVPDSGWEPLAADRFKAALTRAISELDALESGKPSVRW